MASTYVFDLGKRGPQPKPKKLANGVVVNRKEQQQNFVTWNELVRSLWLLNVAAKSPALYDCDISHGSGKCRCRCTPVFDGERKK
jgi:hypothetical protein